MMTKLIKQLRDSMASSHALKQRRQTTILIINLEQCIHLLHGLVVRIPGFHPGGPGSIPGVGSFFALLVMEQLQRLLEIW